MWRHASRAAALYRGASCPSCVVAALRNRPPLLSATFPTSATRSHPSVFPRGCSSTPPSPPPGAASGEGDSPGDGDASGDGGGDDDFDDEFTSILALDPEEAARATAAALAPQDVIASLSSAPRDMSPEQADALVRSLVAAAERSVSPAAAEAGAPPPLTVETVRVLRAARISTNHVVSAAGGEEKFPVERKVVGVLELGEVGLGRLAMAAVEEICPGRVSEGRLRVVGNRFGTREENVGWVVGVLGKVVREAKIAVGEEVDDRVLEDWGEVVQVAREAVAGDTVEVREMVDEALGEEERSSEVVG